MLASPYDPDARLGSKRKEKWTGYKVHITETCDDDKPHLITNVETGKPNQHDNQRIPSIHKMLESKDLLPEIHLVDAGYMDSELLIDIQTKYHLSLLGPVAANHSWQAKTEEAYDLSVFSIDWGKQKVTCPQGKETNWWHERIDKRNGNALIYTKFATQDCAACNYREKCIKSETRARSLCFKPKEKQEALEKARQAQTTPEWQDLYKKRSGIEGTLSQGVRSFGLRRSRYLGQDKTQFQNIAVATAINTSRLAAWFDDAPRAKTRVSRFASLQA